MEDDEQFCYLALERCACTLADALSAGQQSGRSARAQAGDGSEANSSPSLSGADAFAFVDESGKPTPLAFQVRRFELD